MKSKRVFIPVEAEHIIVPSNEKIPQNAIRGGAYNTRQTLLQLQEKLKQLKQTLNDEMAKPADARDEKIIARLNKIISGLTQTLQNSAPFHDLRAQSR